MSGLSSIEYLTERKEEYIRKNRLNRKIVLSENESGAKYLRKEIERDLKKRDLFSSDLVRTMFDLFRKLENQEVEEK